MTSESRIIYFILDSDVMFFFEYIFYNKNNQSGKGEEVIEGLL